MNHFNTILVCILLSSATIAKAQTIQWADKMEFQYNQFNEEVHRYSGHQATGPPDAIPYGNINENAFRLKFPGSFGTLILKFKESQPIQQLVIMENNEPGRIESISLFDKKGTRYQFFEKQVSDEPLAGRALLFKVPQTEYEVDKIEINLNSVPARGWTQIDAVGIADADDMASFSQELNSYGDFVVEEALTFSAKKQSIGPKINTYYIDTKPIIAPDGKTLYFARQNFPGNTNGKNDDQDIYISHLVDGEWTKAENAGYPLNDKNANGVCSVSPDGNRLYVINDASRNNEVGVSVSHRSGSNWSQPLPLNIQQFINKSVYHDYFMSANEQYLLMSIDNDESYGQQDLFVSKRTSEHQWSKPVNLGRVINTGANEFSPFLAADNKTLYFASEGHQARGEADIFYTKRLDDSWENWLTPRNIGDAVNTAGWDAYYAVSAAGDQAFFVSTSHLLDYYEDIYQIALPYEFKPDPVALVKGKVLNAETRKPIDASVIFENLANGYQEGITSSDHINGNYSLVLPMGKMFSYRATSQGFIPLSEYIDLTGKDQYQEVEKDLLLFPIKRGQIIPLNNLFFTRGKSDLLPDSRPELERLLHILNEHPSLVIELGGHTDNQGSSKANIDLSHQRVEKVKDYLLKEGVAKYRISTQGYGGSRPIASNADPEPRKMNRRVEIKILDY